MVKRRFTSGPVAPRTSPFAAASALALLLPGLPAAANPAPAGIIIESTAEAVYDDAGTTRTVVSNTVQVRVDELLSLAAASRDAGPVTVRGGTQVLGFLVTNTGNGPEAFAFEADTAIAGNGFDVTLQDIAVDSNGNGIYDSGIDQLLPAPSLTASLPAGDSITLFAIVTVPPNVGDGARSAIDLIARAATGTGTPGTVFAGAGEGGSDAVVGLGGGITTARGEMVASASTVTLVKWASVADPFGGSQAVPGATITYSVQALVTGSATIDGLVVTDAIPANTAYVANSLTLESAPLTDAPGDDAGEASAAGIAVDLGSVAGGTSRTVTFAVLIAQ